MEDWRQWDRTVLRRTLLSTVAGAAAEQHQFGKHDLFGANESDRHDAFECAEWLLCVPQRWDDELKKRCVQDAPATACSHWQDPVRWAAVCAVAEELLSRTQLTGPETRRIIRSVVREDR